MENTPENNSQDEDKKDELSQSKGPLEPIEPVSPEAVQKEFEDFVKKRFGDQVKVVTQQLEDAAAFRNVGDTAKSQSQAEIDETKEFDLDFDMLPKQIKSELDKFVIKQDEAKKALAIAVCDHYNHVRSCYENPNLAKLDYAKQNVLILGPTGVGKTYLIKRIAKLIGVPFVKADATRFSETGYVGANVDDLIHDLVSQANGDLDLAQYGIVYLDEADKLAGSGSQGMKDVSGRGVQFGLLKLMEEAEVDLRSGNDIRSQMQAFMEFQKRGKLKSQVVNTRHILFIISGAFSGLKEIIAKRHNANAIGFMNGEVQSTLNQDEDLFRLTTTEDLIEFGFEPEFVGRLPIRVSCESLNSEDLYKILKDSAGSILHQYKRSFAAFGIKLTFTDEALHFIAELAAKEKTGARSLMTVCERIFRNFKFELPSYEIDKLVVDKDLVASPEKVLQKLLKTLKPKTIQPKTQYNLSESEELELQVYCDDFNEQHGIEILLTDEAAMALKKRADDEKHSLTDICQQLFKDFSHGLKLIHKNCGKKSFLLDEDIINNPSEGLNEMIRSSYN